LDTSDELCFSGGRILAFAIVVVLSLAVFMGNRAVRCITVNTVFIIIRYIWMFDQATKNWSYKTDNRGTVVYDKSTKQESVVDYLGDIKDTHTAIKPPSADIRSPCRWRTLSSEL
jgi:hypothetical protein